MKIAIEVTSPLQLLFAMSLLKKEYSSEKNIEIDFIFCNNHVNDNLIEYVKNRAAKDYSHYVIKIYDFRGEACKNISEHDVKYEALVVRSILQESLYNKFLFTNNYFKTTGNCNNIRAIQNSFSYNNLYAVDDGLSNWKNHGDGYALSLLRYSYIFFRYGKVLAVPNFLRKSVSLKNFVSYYSIFSEQKEFSIKDEFTKIIQEMSTQYEINYEVENLFIGIWPAFKEDRLSTKNSDCQMDVFCNYVKNRHADYKSRKYFIKYHPKFKLSSDSYPEVSFIELEKAYMEAPLEVIVNRFPNLKNIYGFPSTCFYLMNIISDKAVNVNVFVKEDDSRYFPERADLIGAKNININKIYV
jgi:hypothetical protein